MALTRGPIKSPIKLGELPYTASAVHFDGVSYLLSTLLAFPPQFPFGGGSDGTQITIAGWFKTVWDNTFTPSTIAKGNIIPIFVVDPLGSYGPSLIAQTPAAGIFVLYINDFGIAYSHDGINWKTTSFGGSLGQAVIPLSSPIYLNGLWVFSYASGGDPSSAVDTIFYSYTGTNWSNIFTGNNVSGPFYASVNVPGHGVNPAGSNQIQIDDSNFIAHGGVLSTLSCLNPANTKGNVQSGDSGAFSNSDVIVDPSQGNGNLNFGSTRGFYTANSLPGPITAVRITAPGGNEVMIETTATTITTSIIDNNFSTATWSTRFTQGTTGGNYFYALPSGVLSGGSGNGLGTVGGNTNLNIQTSIVCQMNDSIGSMTPDKLNFWAVSSLTAPQTGQQGTPYAPNAFNANGPLWQQPVWMHFMFTCDSQRGVTNIYINGLQVDLSGSSIQGDTLGSGTIPFTINMNQKIGVVGGDALGNFYIGDMADFSVWNVDLSDLIIIDNNNRQGLASPYNIFLNAATNGPTSPQFQVNQVRFITSSKSGLLPAGASFVTEPIIMLTGDHIQFPQNTLGSAQSFGIVGNLSNAATAPQRVNSP